MNIEQGVILNSSFGGNTNRKRIHGLTVSDVVFVRFLFNCGQMSFEDAMNALKDQYNFYKRVILNEKQIDI